MTTDADRPGARPTGNAWLLGRTLMDVRSDASNSSFMMSSGLPCLDLSRITS